MSYVRQKTLETLTQLGSQGRVHHTGPAGLIRHSLRTLMSVFQAMFAFTYTLRLFKKRTNTEMKRLSRVSKTVVSQAFAIFRVERCRIRYGTFRLVSTGRMSILPE